MIDNKKIVCFDLYKLCDQAFASVSVQRSLETVKPSSVVFDLVAVKRADKCLVQRAMVEIPRLE